MQKSVGRECINPKAIEVANLASNSTSRRQQDQEALKKYCEKMILVAAFITDMECY